MEASVDLEAFYEAMEQNPRLGPIHVSLFVALLQEKTTRKEDRLLALDRIFLMKRAGVFSRSTFYRILHDLQDFGLIRYHPSYDPRLPSTVEFKRL